MKYENVWIHEIMEYCVSKSLYYKWTGTITPGGGELKSAWFSFSEFLVELLNAKCWAVYQIEAFKKLYLV